MAVSAEDVKQVAHLARLQLGPQEAQSLQADLNRILDYMDKLNALDTSGVKPTSHVVPLTNAFGKDEVAPFAATEELLAAAPGRQEGYFRVPPVIE